MSVTINRTTKRRHPAENAKTAPSARGRGSLHQTQQSGPGSRGTLPEELAAGYAANSALDRSISVEFSAVDYETF
jgi:hypothetical protein